MKNVLCDTELIEVGLRFVSCAIDLLLSRSFIRAFCFTIEKYMRRRFFSSPTEVDLPGGSGADFALRHKNTSCIRS